jgi:hypothetical protein
MVWRALSLRALLKAGASEHTSGWRQIIVLLTRRASPNCRLVNLDLLYKYGATAWNVHNTVLEAHTNRRVPRALFCFYGKLTATLG